MRKVRFVLFLCLVFSLDLFAQVKLETKIRCSHLHASRKHASSRARQTAAQDNYDVKFYFLDLHADNQSAFIKAKVSMKAQVTADNLSEIEIGLSNMLQVDSVFLNNVKRTFEHSDDLIRFSAPTALNKDEIFTTIVYYQGNGQTNSFFSGITNAVAQTGERVTYTLSEPENAIDWFACKQVLEDKADSAYIFVTVPSDMEAASNGLLTGISNAAGGTRRFEWKTRYPIAYYLISIAVADYQEYNTSAVVDGKNVPIQNYLYNNPTALSDYKTLLDLTGPMVEEMSSLFGAYPFADEKYGHAMAPLGGGMEHQTMSTMDGFDFTLIAHELGHQWFGDAVTCATWQDIWVNEGFARYAEYLMIERLMSKDQADGWMSLVYDNALTRTSGSVYVPLALAQDENRIFDGSLTYNKGGALLHMIRFIVDDDEKFFQALTTFQEQFRHKVATGLDFKAVLESVTGKDFTNFFDEWYFGQGFPEYAVRWNYDSDTLYIRQTQTTTHPSVNFYHVPMAYQINFDDGDQTIRLEAESDSELFAVYTGKPVKSITVDPSRIILKKVKSVVRDSGLKAPITTAVEPPSENEFAIHPNPAVSSIQIFPRSDEPYSITIINAHGANVLQTTQRGEFVSPPGSLAAGMYAVRIANVRGTVVRRVLLLE